jgi:hypothetical protein
MASKTRHSDEDYIEHCNIVKYNFHSRTVHPDIIKFLLSN